MANNRVQVEIAGSSTSPKLEEEGKAHSQNGIHGYAYLAADLTGAISPVAATFEMSFLSEASDEVISDQRYFAGRSWMGLF